MLCFSNVYTSDSVQAVLPNAQHLNDSDYIDISVKPKIKGKLSMRPDNIPPFLIKDCRQNLV